MQATTTKAQAHKNKGRTETSVTFAVERRFRRDFDCVSTTISSKRSPSLGENGALQQKLRPFPCGFSGCCIHLLLLFLPISLL